MKKFLISILTLLISSATNATELENTLNKVYGKGTDIAENYISNLLDGPGETEVTLAKKRNINPTGHIMIVRPISVGEDSLIFYQAQLNTYQVEDSDRQSLNFGIGERYLSNDKSYFWGVNAFFDIDSETNSRLGIGGELKASAFNVNGNYYLDALGGGGNGVGSSSTERVLDGYDMNITGQVPYVPWANVNYNNYTWKANKATKNSEGEIYSAIVYLPNDFTLEFGQDYNSITKNNNFAKLTYVPSANKNRPTYGDGFSSTAFQNSDVSKDMLTKVKRSNIITLEVESSGVVLVNGN